MTDQTTIRAEKELSNPDAHRASVGRHADLELTDRPINPEWILSGNPRARAAQHSESLDGWAATHAWECTAGRFRWHFTWEETVLIVEGEVRVTDALGTTTTLRAGDVSYFPADSWFVWEIDEYVRKLAFCRLAVPRRVRRTLSAVAFVRALPRRVVGKVLRMTGLMPVLFAVQSTEFLG